MKKTCCIFLLLLTGFSVTSQSLEKTFGIEAFLPSWRGASIQLIIDDKPIATGLIQSDIFNFKGTTQIPKQGLIQINKQKQTVFVPLFIETGIIKIRDAGNNRLVPFNTISNDTYLAINDSFDSLAALKKLKTFSESMAYKRTLAADFIKQHPSSIVSVQLLKDYFYLRPEADDTIYYNLVSSLDQTFIAFPSVQKMRHEASMRNATAVGRIAPKQILPDTAQKKTEIYESGHYTFVDFWASWCIPCRKENPHLLKIYEKYRDRGLRITGVSLDTNKLLWKNAIKQDKLQWKQLSDLKGWGSIIVSTYGIKTLPMNYLINREGVIIAKNLYASDLDLLLAKVLNSVPQNANIQEAKQ